MEIAFVFVRIWTKVCALWMIFGPFIVKLRPSTPRNPLTHHNMTKESLSWEGGVEISLNGIEYTCNIECSIEIQHYTNKHEPFYYEPMTDTLVCLEQWEAECGGKPVHNAQLRRELRAELVEWVENNEPKIIREAR